MKEIIEEIQAYKPFTQQEANDQKLFLKQIQYTYRKNKRPFHPSPTALDRS